MQSQFLKSLALSILGKFALNLPHFYSSRVCAQLLQRNHSLLALVIEEKKLTLATSLMKCIFKSYLQTNKHLVSSLVCRSSQLFQRALVSQCCSQNDQPQLFKDGQHYPLVKSLSTGRLNRLWQQISNQKRFIYTTALYTCSNSRESTNTRPTVLFWYDLLSNSPQLTSVCKSLCKHSIYVFYFLHPKRGPGGFLRSRRQ